MAKSLMLYISFSEKERKEMKAQHGTVHQGHSGQGTRDIHKGFKARKGGQYVGGETPAPISTHVFLLLIICSHILI